MPKYNPISYAIGRYAPKEGMHVPPAPWAAVQFTGPALYQTFNVGGGASTVRRAMCGMRLGWRK